MQGGHNIKSKKDKVLAGTTRADRDDDRLENFVPTLVIPPAAPPNLDAKHRKVWDKMAAKLVELGVLTNADLEALEIMVKNMVLSETAWKSVHKEGTSITVSTEFGEKKIVNPDFMAYKQCQAMLKPLLEQFGLTPRSRQSLKVKEAEQADPLANLLKPTNGAAA